MSRSRDRDPGTGRRTVLVPRLGWRSGAWACRSLAAQFHVIAGEDEGCIPNRTRYCHELVRHPAVSSDPEAFVDWVVELCSRRGVAAILPIDDEVVQLLGAVQPSGFGGAVLVGPTQAQYRRLCDKSALMELASSVGFVGPQQTIVTDAGRDGDWPVLPSMVKPRAPGMAAANGLVTRKPVLVTSWWERDRAVRELIDAIGEALIEEHVEGAAWRVHFVRTATGMASLTLRAVRSYPPRTGQSSVQRVDDRPPPGLVECAERLLAAVGYVGPGSVQVIDHDRGFFVHDVNLRLPVSVGATISGGLDMPRLGVSAALGELTSVPSIESRPVTYVSLLGEAQHLVDGLRGRDVSAPPYRVAAELLLAALAPGRVLDPVNPRDPLPILLGVGEVGRRLARTRLSRTRTDAQRAPRRLKA